MDLKAFKRAARNGIAIARSNPISLWVGISSELGHACGRSGCGDRVAMFFHTETNAKICFDHLHEEFPGEAIKLHWHKTMIDKLPKRIRKLCKPCEGRGYLVFARPTATGSRIPCKPCAGSGLIMREVSV